jgi:hypothetical protein
MPGWKLGHDPLAGTHQQSPHRGVKSSADRTVEEDSNHNKRAKKAAMLLQLRVLCMFSQRTLQVVSNLGSVAKVGSRTSNLEDP